VPESVITPLSAALPVLPVHVKRRDGEAVLFDASRIESAILRACRATRETDWVGMDIKAPFEEYEGHRAADA